MQLAQLHSTSNKTPLEVIPLSSQSIFSRVRKREFIFLFYLLLGYRGLPTVAVLPTLSV